MGCMASLPDSNNLPFSYKESKDTFKADIIESKSSICKQVNEYIFLKSLGHGSYANVYLVQSNITQLFYACKLFSKTTLKKRKILGKGVSSDQYEIVKREISIMKLLRHKNIVELIEIIDDPTVDQLFLIIEYVKSHSSITFSPKSLVRSSTNVSRQFTNTEVKNVETSISFRIIDREVECRSYFIQLIDGVSYMHSLNICHRDIKPENILFGENGLKICDFGVSIQFDEENDFFKESAGSAAFMAPEMCVASNESFSARKTDIWACGVTLFVLLFDVCPFMAQTVPSIYVAIVNQPLEIPGLTYPRHFKDVLSGIPLNESDDRCSRTSPELVDLLKGILHKDPSTRFSIADLKSHPWMNM